MQRPGTIGLERKMVYRTRTYIAADWDGDRDVVEQLHKWNDSNYWGLSFPDAHDLQQSRDSSLPCSIKSSLKKRMDGSKRFVLIVGDSTNSVTKGSCQYCKRRVIIHGLRAALACMALTIAATLSTNATWPFRPASTLLCCTTPRASTCRNVLCQFDTRKNISL